jgi:single-stranded DNA-binding protein
VNKVELSGKIYKPHTKYTPNGTCIWEASIGVSRKVKEEWKTEFFDLVAIGKTAEGIGDTIQDKAAVDKVSGCLRQEKWEDKDGAKRQRVRVVVFEIVSKGATKQEVAGDDPDIPF